MIDFLRRYKYYLIVPTALLLLALGVLMLKQTAMRRRAVLYLFLPCGLLIALWLAYPAVAKLAGLRAFSVNRTTGIALFSREAIFPNDDRYVGHSGQGTRGHHFRLVPIADIIRFTDVPPYGYF